MDPYLFQKSTQLLEGQASPPDKVGRGHLETSLTAVGRKRKIRRERKKMVVGDALHVPSLILDEKDSERWVLATCTQPNPRWEGFIGVGVCYVYPA